MVIEIGDATGAGFAPEPHVGLEIGHARLPRRGWGSLMSGHRSVLLRSCFADTAVDVRGSGTLHVVGDVDIYPASLPPTHAPAWPRAFSHPCRFPTPRSRTYALTV